MITTENLYPPFPGNLGKPGSRKLEIDPPLLGKLGQLGKMGRMHQNFPGKLGLLSNLGKIHPIFLGKLGKIHPLSFLRVPESQSES